MRKSLKARVVCLAVAGVMLTGSLVVAAVNGSPYETLKNAMFNSMVLENVTMDSEFRITVNGVTEEIDRSRSRIVLGGGSRNDYRFDRFGNLLGVSYESPTLRINSMANAGDTIHWFSARLTPDDNFNSFSDSNTISGFSADDRNSAYFRFAEILVDLVVGDLKHNLYMTSNDGIRRVNGAITHNQLPELVRVGMDIIVEETQRNNRHQNARPEDFRDPLDAPMQSITFNRINGTADIDPAGNLIYMHAGALLTIVDIFDRTNTVEIDGQIWFSDIGVSVPQIPVAGTSIFTPEFMEAEFGSRYRQTVHFTLDADGAVDTSSLTTRWPSSSDRGR